MELWQAVLGSSLAILVGIVIGVLYSYIHLRVVEKTSVNLKAIFHVLFRASNTLKPRTDYSRVFVNGVIRKKQQLNRVLKKISSFILLEIHQASSVLKPKIAYSGNSILGIIRKQPELPDNLDKTITSINNTAIPVNQSQPLTSNISSLISTANDRTRLTVNQHLVNHPLTPLMDEFEQNLKTIREFTGDKLIPLRTDSWEANQQVVQRLSKDLRISLESIYTDISLLNHLVWLSSEFNRNSQNILVQYEKLSSIIADNLDKIIAINLNSAQDERPFASSIRI